LKSFRQILIAATLTLGAFTAVLYTSCKNKCGGTTCQNSGTCSDNVCICPEGYSGNACQTGWSTACIGTYNCTRENCTPAVTGVKTWQSAITADATNGGYTIDISNFNNSNTTVIATIDSAETPSSAVQQITVSTAAGTYGVNATGTYNVINGVGIINLSYTTLLSGGTTYDCNMVMTKQ